MALGCLFAAAGVRGEIYRVNGELIPGTEGITPGPTVRLDARELRFANLAGHDLTSTSFSASDLSRADLSRAILTEADLSGANLAAANLESSRMSATSLVGANLASANLSLVLMTEDGGVQDFPRSRRYGPGKCEQRSAYLVERAFALGDGPLNTIIWVVNGGRRPAPCA